MDRQHIIEEIQRTAAANGGKALGKQKFSAETGIKIHDWYGKFWSRWGDAVREAGLEPNRLSEAIPEEVLIQKLALFTRTLGRVPVDGEIRLASRNDPSFPGRTALVRLGNKSQQKIRVIAYCNANHGYEDVAELWSRVEVKERRPGDDIVSSPVSSGYVYMLKHGSRREYKIGRTNNAIRREGEIAIQLPEKVQPVHYIATDDPAGVEAYWHARFASKRKEGEWFELTADDVRAFKRWKRIL